MMWRRWSIFLLFAWLVWTVPLTAVGTATVTNFNAVYTIAWTSSAGGVVSANSFSIRRGTITQVKFVPGSGGAQPSDLYDVTLVDADGLDLLGGLGANLSNAAPVGVTDLHISVVSPTATNLTLDLQVANAGSTKSGTVYLWVQP